MTANDVIQIVQTVGFPVLCCFWLAHRVEKRLDSIAKQMQRMVTALALIEAEDGKASSLLKEQE